MKEGPKQSLRTFSTIKIGGSPELLLGLSDLGKLSRGVPEPIRILGNGSNILIDDHGLKGTVIVTRDFSDTDPEILSEDAESVRIHISAGFYLPRLASWALKRGLSGCEYFVGIPGTVGGAIVQNAGANEQEMSMILESAVAFDLISFEDRDFTASDCRLLYRSSRFKAETSLLLTSAVLRLEKKDPQEVQNRMNLNLAYRKQKTPYSKPSLGSIFTRLRSGETWLYPGKLIEDAGLKGERIGGAAVSSVHANYIVNEGGATFEDALRLMEKIESKVFENSGVTLHREILIWSDRPSGAS